MGFVPGQKITPTLELVRLLGQGGMGSVWSARHSGLDLDVAVKFISADLAKTEDPIVVERFKREAKLAARIDSAHVVRTFDHGLTSEGIPYIVMELLRGESLHDRMVRKRRLSPQEVGRIVREAARGLERAHGAQIVHRDIKPHNLFLAEHPEGGEIVKILDFGVAKARSKNEAQSVATSTGVLIGTPQYMSPEQLMRAGPVEPSADLWALAVVAYEMLAGKLPFRGETLAATIMAITRADVVPPSSVEPTLPPSVDHWFQRALAVDPVKRFKSARELGEALEAAVEGIETIEPRTDSIPHVTGPIDLRANQGTGEFLREAGIEPMPLSTRGFALAETHHARAPKADGETLRSAKEESAAAAAAAVPTKDSASTRTALAIEKPAEIESTGPLSEGPATRYRRRWTPARIGALSVGLLVVGVGSGVLVTRLGAESPPPFSVPPPAPTQSAVPSASPEKSAVAETPPRRVGMIRRTTIESGLVPLSRVWLPSFTLAREPGDEDATMVDAQAACQAKAMSLCTESQWSRACEANPDLAASVSWTASTTDRGVILRGKSAPTEETKGDCTSRDVVAPDTHDPQRIGVCCSRVVGVAGETSNPAFLATTSAKLLDFETAANAGNGARAGLQVDDPLMLFGVMRSRKELEDYVNWRSRSRFFLVHDACELAIEKRSDGDRWSADCPVTVLDPNGVTKLSRHYVRGGPKGLLLSISEPKAPMSIEPKTPRPVGSSEPSSRPKPAATP